MDYKEQQEQECEALEAIYQEEEFEIENREYPNVAIRVYLNSNQDQEDETDDDFQMSLLLELPENYPDVIPKITVEELDELFSEERIQQIVEDLEKEATENLGMVMVFTVVSAMQDEIGKLVTELKTRTQQKFEEEKEKQEAVSRRRFEGTIVTQDSFRQWKARFDEERRALIDKKIKEREAFLAGRLTGRELFLKDATLNLSDVALIQQSVEIDESLFDAEDLDALDIDDSEEDEEEED